MDDLKDKIDKIVDILENDLKDNTKKIDEIHRSAVVKSSVWGIIGAGLFHAIKWIWIKITSLI